MKEYEYRPFKFFFLTFLVTWISWFSAAYLSFRYGNEALYILCMLPGLMAPAVIALIMIFASGNRELKKEYISKIINIKRIKLSCIIPMVVIIPIVVVISILISTLFGESIKQLTLADGFSFSAGAVPVLLILFLAASFEELGWRGYAMDSLGSKFNLFTTTWIFAALWALWHLPLFFIKDYYQYEILHMNIWFALNFIVSIFPLAFILSWLCRKNKGSILAAVLFHFFVNIMQEITNLNQVGKCIETGVLILVAAIIIILNKDLFFKKQVIES